MWRFERPGLAPAGPWLTMGLLSRWLMLACLLALGGCVVAPPQPSTTTGIIGNENEPREWAGRFSVLMQNNGFEQRQDSAIGRFRLNSAPAPSGRTLALELTSPFGQVLASGTRQPDGRSTLLLADGRTLQAPTLDAVLELALGWPLPIERLPDWLDDRFEEVTLRDGQGQVLSASDSGWRIEREPRRWALERVRPEGRLRVVLILDR